MFIHYLSKSSYLFSRNLVRFYGKTSNQQRILKPTVGVVTMSYSDELKTKFNNHFPYVVQNLVEHSEKSASSISTNIKWALDRLKTSLEYNVPFGKQTRGLTVVKSYYAICGNDISPELEKTLLSLGWAVELLQASFLVADDVMDQSRTRRGNLCWYKQPQIGLSAINDAFLLESCVFTLLKLSSKDQSFYLSLVDLFHSTILNTQIGQTLDTAITSNENRGDFAMFTEKYYMDTITYKTSFYSFYLPVAVAMYVAGYNDETLHGKVSDILVKIGQLFQIQDDYLDCFGDAEVTGKIGTDIEENKCTWLIVQALKVAKEEDVKKLKANYGRDDADMVQVVKSIYSNLELDAIYRRFEKETYEKIICDISEFKEEGIPGSIFIGLLEKIYQRKK